MAVTKDDMLETISNMSVMEVVELIEAMEEKFGVSAAPAVAVSASGADGETDNAAEEKTEFDVVMNSFGNSKVAVIKAVRGLTGLGLKEAKDKVEATPATIKEAVSKEEAEDAKKQLEEAGAKVEVK